MMDSEPELERRRADLTMIIRPDARPFTIPDILIEFTFASLKDAGLNGEQAMSEARAQVHKNMEILNRKYADLRLLGYAVVSLGFERICWKEVTVGR
jgi:hypothetical protein